MLKVKSRNIEIPGHSHGKKSTLSVLVITLSGCQTNPDAGQLIKSDCRIQGNKFPINSTFRTKFKFRMYQDTLVDLGFTFRGLGTVSDVL